MRGHLYFSERKEPVLLYVWCNDLCSIFINLLSGGMPAATPLLALLLIVLLSLSD